MDFTTAMVALAKEHPSAFAIVFLVFNSPYMFWELVKFYSAKHHFQSKLSDNQVKISQAQERQIAMGVKHEEVLLEIAKTNERIAKTNENTAKMLMESSKMQGELLVAHTKVLEAILDRLGLMKSDDDTALAEEH